MRLTCSRPALLRALRLLGNAVDLQSTLPVLANVLLTADGRADIRLAATNLHLGISCRVEGAVEEEGEACVPVHPLLSYLAGLTDQALVLQTRGIVLAGETPATMLVVNSHLALTSLDGQWFPGVHCPSHYCVRIRLDAAHFKVMCRRAACAATKKAAEPLLSCVWFYIQGRTITLATCDLQRCAMQTLACAGEGSIKELFFLPALPLLTLMRLLPTRGEVELLIDAHKSLLCLRTAGADFLLRLVDGQVAGSERTRKLIAPLQQESVSSLFEQFVPHRYTTLVQVSRKALQAVVRKQSRTMACALETGRDGQGTLVLRVYQPDAIITHRLPVQVWGPVVDPWWLNMRLLADVLCCPGTPAQLVLALGDPSYSVLLRWMGPDGVDASFSYVFKPLDRYTLSRLPQIRQELPEVTRRWVERQGELAQQRQEALPLIQLRTAVLYRIACILHYALTPTKEEIQQSVAQVKRLADQSDDYKRDACVRSSGELTHVLALAAFAPGGSSLELSTGGHSIRLLFHAGQIHTALQEARKRG